MAMSAVMSWFGKPMRLDPREEHLDPPHRLEPLVSFDLDPPLPDPARPPRTWTAERIATTDALWGAGYQFPGGEKETLRLAKPLGLSAASSLLLLGAGGGGHCYELLRRTGKRGDFARQPIGREIILPQAHRVRKIRVGI